MLWIFQLIVIIKSEFQVHDDVKWNNFPCYWTFVRGINRSPVNSSHKSQWRGALMLSLICAWIQGWVINRQAGDLRRHLAHYDVTVMDSRCLGLTYETIICALCLPALLSCGIDYILCVHWTYANNHLCENQNIYVKTKIFLTIHINKLTKYDDNIISDTQP